MKVQTNPETQKAELTFKFNPQSQGLNCFLGPLESEILCALWDDPRKFLTNKQILRGVVRRGYVISLTTITTTTRRLTTHGVLQEITMGGIYTYRPVITENDLIETVIAQVMNRIFDTWPEKAKELLSEFGTA